MKTTYITNLKNVIGLRNCKIVNYNDKIILIGSKKYKEVDSIIKYLI